MTNDELSRIDFNCQNLTSDAYDEYGEEAFSPETYCKCGAMPCSYHQRPRKCVVLYREYYEDLMAWAKNQTN